MSSKTWMPEWLSIVLLGIIEGVTEFLPVSSTGHLLIAEPWLGGSRGDLFNSVIQCGAVLAVVMAFAGRLKHLWVNRKSPESIDFVLKLGVAFFITGVGGLALKASGFKQQDEAMDPKRLATIVAWTTMVGGFVIFGLEAWLKKRQHQSQITWTVAIGTGAAQLLAVLLPGTSRSAATILTAMGLGIARPAATEFSFLLGVPTLLSAGALQVYSAHKHGETVNWGLVLLGSAVACVTAFATVKWLLRYVQTHTFNLFGWYRVVLGAVILLILTLR